MEKQATLPDSPTFATVLSASEIELQKPSSESRLTLSPEREKFRVVSTQVELPDLFEQARKKFFSP